MTKAVKQVGILGVGSYLPSKILTNHDLEKMVDTSDEWIVQRTGIRTRHIAAPEQATSDMALIAARRALEDAGVAPADLDLIIVATATPDYGVYPSTACLVQDRLWATHAAAFDLSAGCTGFVYGVSVAAQMIASGVYKKALVIGAETLSRILNWEDRNTCVLFGDGAGAAVLGEKATVFWALTLAVTAQEAFTLCSPQAAAENLPATKPLTPKNIPYI